MCCSLINMLGNLWLASFAIGSIAVFLLMTMFAYIAQLDKLPPRACAPILLAPNTSNVAERH